MADNLEVELSLLWRRVYARAAEIAREEVLRQFGPNLRGGKLAGSAIGGQGTLAQSVIAPGTSGQVLTTSGGVTTWAAGTSGTVTSVGLTAPSFLSVAGSPVTGSGTLALTLASQSAHAALIGPTSGGAATPTFRALVPADYPTFVASGASHAAGAVPDPGSSAGTTHFLREDATWATLPTATSSSLGVVQPDNSTITSSAGVLSATGANATIYSLLVDPATPDLLWDPSGDVIACPA